MLNESPVARFLFTMACFVIVVAGMRAAEQLLVPFLLSLFIAVLCSPPLAWMKRKGIPNAFAIVIIIALVVVIGIGIGTVVGQSIASFRLDLPLYQARLAEQTNAVFLGLESWDLDMDQLRGGFNPAAALNFVGATLASFGNLMTSALLILLTVVFILAENVGFADKLQQARPGGIKTTLAISRFTQSINRYMAIKSILSLITGVFIMVWLWVQGVDYFVLWGLLAFLLNFVPNLGSILAAVPAVLLSLVQLGVGDAMITAAGFLLVNVVIGNLLEPRIMGRGLDLSALVVFLSLVFWGWVLGPVGMLLSVPLTMTLKIALESFEETRWLAVILGSGESRAAVVDITAAASGPPSISSRVDADSAH